MQGVFLVHSVIKINNSNARTYLINTTEKEFNIETPVINVDSVLIDTSSRDSLTFAINLVISNNLMDNVTSGYQKPAVILEHIL